MKKLMIGAVLLGLTAATGPAEPAGGKRTGAAYSEERAQAVRFPGERRVAREVRQLNRMRDHLGAKMRLYSAGPKTWREFRNASREVQRLTERVREGGYTALEIRGQIRFLRLRLNRIERHLLLRPNDVFVWDNRD